MAAYVPTKRCTDLTKHEPHDWKQDGVFKRWCPGRTATKLNSRSRRSGNGKPPVS